MEKDVKLPITLRDVFPDSSDEIGSQYQKDLNRIIAKTGIYKPAILQALLAYRVFNSNDTGSKSLPTIEKVSSNLGITEEYAINLRGAVLDIDFLGETYAIVFDPDNL